MNQASPTYLFSRNRIHPQKFALWAAQGGILMMFAAFTSAFLVRRSAGNWLEFRLPEMFLWSSAVIVLSSVVLHLSYKAFRNSNMKTYRGLLALTLILAFTFLLFQYLGWKDLMSVGIMINGNPSGSFVYVISGIHAAHVLGGIVALLIASIHAFMLPDVVTDTRIHRFQLTYTYWHFMGFLWLYVFGFMLFNT